jgi:hypothetical protein
VWLDAVVPGQPPGQSAPPVVGRFVGGQSPPPQAAPAGGVPPLGLPSPLHVTRIDDPVRRRKSPRMPGLLILEKLPGMFIVVLAGTVGS